MKSQLQRTLSLLFILTMMVSCSTTKDATTKDVNSPIDEVRVLDTLVVDPDYAVDPTDEKRPPYRASYTRTVDLIHTDLSVSFDMEARSVKGMAALQMEPLFYDQSSVVLDAKGFDINGVAVMGEVAQYDYDGEHLTISLGRLYEKGERFKLVIDYVAHPYRGDAGGSAAINSARGLYFIDPMDKDPLKPTQIWTQGETESSSRWFPTIDKPNERHTHTFEVTVPDAYRTLSNGELTEQVSNKDGSRTDTWTMDKSHAPYLAMLAIGEFHTEDDMWNKVPLEYIVEAPYADDAKEIFNHTPEMMTFFSDILGYPYPWNKYSQVVVRDYVSGAMENTTASLYGQQLQRPASDLIDNGNDRIVAHELFHHWFGDLVTCESWSHLTLNEGFANYSEYMWLDHKYGRDEADWHRYNEFQGYLGQAGMQVHPLIDFHYEDKEDMFDAHSYNKGGMVLHMLRQIVGDEAFFASLNDYLNTMAYKAAEVHDLRLAFERVTGRDLNGFFNQWFLSPGHPELSVDVQYLPEQARLEVTVDQTQTSKGWRVFDLMTELMIVEGDGDVRTEKVHLHEGSQTLTFKVSQAPLLVLLDPKRDQLATIDYKTAPDLANNYDRLISLWYRMDALAQLEALEGSEHESLVSKGLTDEAWPARQRAMTLAKDGILLDAQFRQIAKSDQHAKVRAAAVDKTKAPTVVDVNGWMMDKSTMVQAAAARRLLDIDVERAKVWAAANEDSRSLQVLAAVAQIYAQTETPDKASFFSGPALDALSGYDERFAYYDAWGSYIAKTATEEDMLKQAELWVDQLTDEDADMLTQYSLLTALGKFAQEVDKSKLSDDGKNKIGGIMTKVGMAAAKLMQ